MNPKTFTLGDVNGMNEAAFVEAFGTLYEHTPEVATQAWRARPFPDLAGLTSVMQKIVEGFDQAARLKLIREHPQLGRSHGLSPASREEQSSAGLTRLAEQRAAELARLNQDYLTRFGFPFVVAVKHLQGREVATVLKSRLGNDVETEVKAAMAEIQKIAALRLQCLVNDLL